MTSAQRSGYRPRPTDNVGHVFSTKVAKLACERREGLADIGRQAAEEMPTHVAKRPNTGTTAVRASVEGSHLLSGFAQPSETMPKRARRILATPRVSRTPFLPPPRVVESAES